MKSKPDISSTSAAEGKTRTDAQAPVAASMALRLAEPGAGGAQLSPAQKRFNSLLTRIDKLKAQISDIQMLADTHRSVHESTITPLREQCRLQMRAMALWLDDRVQRKDLTPLQLRTANEIFYGLCESLAAAGDEEMRELHDKRSPQSLEEKHRIAAADMRADMESFLGKTLDMDDADEGDDPFEALLKAGLDQVQEAVQAEQARWQSTQAPHGVKKPAAAARKAAQKTQQQEEADTILRKVYRQLASALHPDRERDPLEQKRKTALMSEANAAYARQDLMALLHIQLRIEQIGPGSLTQMPEEKIAAMSVLLKQQADELKRELEGRQQHVQHEFDLSPYDKPSASSLRNQLWMQERGLQRDLAQMAFDLKSVQSAAGFKRWLKSQKQAMKEAWEDDEDVYF